MEWLLILPFVDLGTIPAMLACTSTIVMHDTTWKGLAIAFAPGGHDFWEYAKARSPSLSKPTGTWYGELKRLKIFQDMIYRTSGNRLELHHFKHIWASEDVRSKSRKKLATLP
jgi:hypothetical protein